MIAVGDVWRFALIQKLFGQDVVNTFAMQVDFAPVAMTENDFVNAFFADATGRFNAAGGMRQKIRDAQSNEVTHVRWEAFRVTVPTTQMFVREIVTDPAGAYANTCETANLSASITRRGELGGKRQRGRIAVAGIPTVHIAAGAFVDAGIANLTAVADAIRGSHVLANGVSAILGYWSPQHTAIIRGVVRDYPPLFVRAASSKFQREVRVQRSRTLGVGS